MGWTSENVATNFKISREAMDQVHSNFQTEVLYLISLTFHPKLGVTSHQRASAAQRSGRFTAEIMPFKTRLIDPALPDSPPKSVVITEDDGIRHNASLENFAKAKSAFPQWGEGKSTGPNSSQVTDGAAATVLMRRSKAVTVTSRVRSPLKNSFRISRKSLASRSSANMLLQLSSVSIRCFHLFCEILKIFCLRCCAEVHGHRACFRHSVSMIFVLSSPSKCHLYNPYSVRFLRTLAYLKKTSISGRSTRHFRLCMLHYSSTLASLTAFDRYVYCLEQLGLDVHKVNVNGGAIALGHPLGATGVRQVVTGLSELARRGQSVLCTSMCIGSG